MEWENGFGVLFVDGYYVDTLAAENIGGGGGGAPISVIPMAII